MLDVDDITVNQLEDEASAPIYQINEDKYRVQNRFRADIGEEDLRSNNASQKYDRHNYSNGIRKQKSQNDLIPGLQDYNPV
jgi:hypothetical protein